MSSYDLEGVVAFPGARRSRDFFWGATPMMGADVYAVAISFIITKSYRIN